MDADIVIIGAGPAGLQAAIHAARKKVKVVVVGKNDASALNKAEIENYLGIESIPGADILRVGREQARRFGAEMVEEDVIKARKEDDLFVIATDHAREIRTKSIILAMGISRAKLNIPGEKEYLGKGVSYCASCDAPFFKGRKVAVVGESSEAAESVHLLAEYSNEVHWIAPELKTTEQMLDKAKKPNVAIKAPAKPVRILGERTVVGLELDDGTKLDVHGVFIALGSRGSTELALELGILPDPDGHIPIDTNCKTEMDMVYACGDVTGKPWQLAKAVGQGCVAGDNLAALIRQKKG